MPEKKSRGGGQGRASLSPEGTFFARLVVRAPGQNGLHVCRRGGETDLLAKRGRRGGLALGHPAVYPAAARIVLRQRVGLRIIPPRPVRQCAGKVPGADLHIHAGGEKVARHEGLHLVVAHPIGGGRLAHLHEPALAHLAHHAGAEGALAPDHGFDEQRIHPVAVGGIGDERIIPPITAQREPLARGVARVLRKQPHPTCHGKRGQEAEECGFGYGTAHDKKPCPKIRRLHSPAMKFARVLVDQSGGSALDYAIPPELEGAVQVGSRVHVPIRHRQALATVIELLESTEVPNVRPLTGVAGKRPVLGPNLLRLARWMSQYYCCALETAMRAVLPQVVRKGEVGFKEQRTARLARAVEPELLEALRKRAPKQAAVVDTLAESGGPLPIPALLKTAGADRASLASLVQKGFLAIETAIVSRDPHERDTFVPAAPHELNAEQSAVFAEVCRALEKPEKPQLLYGVTGSGKTEIYLQAIQRVLDEGKSAIMLVPEIALTPQTVERFKSRFAAIQGEVAVLHSHLSQGERHDEWHKINDGRARIVIGARSAIFAPLERLGLIVVDEEHENSYKQEEAPRYHARDLAVLRGAFEGCAVLLGSATPSLESFHNATTGKYQLLRMALRIDDRKLPYIRIIDMRLESRGGGGATIISEKMRQGIEARLARKEQSILFLNRRGFSTSLACHACGFVAECPNCSVSLTFHRAENRILCHICVHVAIAPSRCPECKDPGIKYSGIGTEKVEESVSRLFPKAEVRRMDADTMTRKEAYRETLTAFRTGKIDILLGTQMIAKGLHFPNVTLVGIINADLGLHLPDFRAGERTFQLLTQVAGRAGRGDVEGEVFVQTFTPHHPAIQYARHHDYDGFAEQETEWRRQLAYPPFIKMVLITARSPHAERGLFSMETLARRLKEQLPPEVTLGEPTPAPLEKSHGNFRFHLTLRTHAVQKTTRVLGEVLEKLTFPEDVSLSVDVDPYQLL